MIGAGIFPGDYVIVRRQESARPGQLIIALSEGKNNLKQLLLDEAGERYILHSCNPDRDAYPDILTKQLEIQGVVGGVYHSVGEAEQTDGRGRKERVHDIGANAKAQASLRQGKFGF